MGSALGNAAWHPIPPPPYTGQSDISTFPVDTRRNAVNQGGVGGFNNGSNWRLSPTNAPFVGQPGPVYGMHRKWSQEYRADAGWYVQIAPPAPGLLPPYLLAGTRKSGGVPTGNALQARVASLIAMRQRVARKTRVQN